jgi:hypothetical protein
MMVSIIERRNIKAYLVVILRENLFEAKGCTKVADVQGEPLCEGITHLCVCVSVCVCVCVRVCVCVSVCVQCIRECP